MQDENENESRNRRPSLWLKDYDNGEGLSDEEAEVNTIQTDPEDYETIVKCPTWRQDMDAEIESIGKNGNWKLTELPEELKG